MTRRQRQFDEVRSLCRSGIVGRAVDLAFEHFACFGPDERVIEVLAEAIGQASAAEEVRHRFDELIARTDGDDGGSARPGAP